MGVPGPHIKKVQGPRPTRFPRFCHLWADVIPSFAGHYFRLMWYYLPIHRCSFWFLFNLKNVFVSLCVYNSRTKLLTLITPIKIWCLEVGGSLPPRKKVGKRTPMRPPWLRHLCDFVMPSFAWHSFRAISGETWYYLPIHRCWFWFLFNLKYIFLSLCMYNSKIKLLTLI